MKYNYNGFWLFAIFNFFIFNYKLFSQSVGTPGTPYELGMEGHVGFVLKHTDKLDPVKIGTPYAFQFSYMRNTIGNNRWEQLYKYPSYGFSIGYLGLGNKSVLGGAITALANFQLHFLRFKNTSVSWSFNPGIAYCNTVYNPESNRINQAISAHINYTLQSNFAFNKQISPRAKVKILAGLTHISNGSIKKPNLGINVPMAAIGVSYNPYFTAYSLRKDSIPRAEKNLNLNVHYAVSFSRLDTANQTLFPAHVLGIYLSKRVSHLHSFLFGIEGIYDKSIAADIEKQKSWGVDVSKARVERALVTVGHELSITRLALTSQFCFYVYKPFKSKSWSYQRFQFKYYLSDHFFIACALRTHFGTADGAELGAGIKL